MLPLALSCTFERKDQAASKSLSSLLVAQEESHYTPTHGQEAAHPLLFLGFVSLQKASGKAPVIHPGDEPPFLCVRWNQGTFRSEA